MFNDIKDLTKNKFLGNKLEILQLSDGYRGNMDSVLVAASVTAESGQKVLELGCGNGVALCCLLYRIGGLEVYGIEIDKRASELCRQNIRANGLKATIFNSDIATGLRELKSVSFDHVFMNPPYFKRNSVKKSPFKYLIISGSLSTLWMIVIVPFGLHLFFATESHVDNEMASTLA